MSFVASNDDDQSELICEAANIRLSGDQVIRDSIQINVYCKGLNCGRSW